MRLPSSRMTVSGMSGRLNTVNDSTTIVAGNIRTPIMRPNQTTGFGKTSRRAPDGPIF